MPVEHIVRRTASIKATGRGFSSSLNLGHIRDFIRQADAAGISDETNIRVDANASTAYSIYAVEES